METTIQTVEQLNAILPDVSWERCAFLSDGQLRLRDDHDDCYTIDRSIWSHPTSPIRTAAHRLWKVYPSAPWSDNDRLEKEQPVVTYVPIDALRENQSRPL